MLDESEFLSPYGLRALSRYHLSPHSLNVVGICLLPKQCIQASDNLNCDPAWMRGVPEYRYRLDESADARSLIARIRRTAHRTPTTEHGDAKARAGAQEEKTHLSARVIPRSEATSGYPR